MRPLWGPEFFVFFPPLLAFVVNIIQRVTFVTRVVVEFTTRHNEGMNIFQEAIIAVWFLVKMSFLILTVIGAKVVWDKYGHIVPTRLTDFIHKDEDDEAWSQ